MVRVDIESIVMASGPMPSVVVLRERKGEAGTDTPLRALAIQTGTYEAAAIGHGAEEGKQAPRPITHDLLHETVKKLGARVERIEINRWEAPIFYADIVLECSSALARDDNDASNTQRIHEVKIDARPSDALALAARSNAPIYVEDDVMNRAGSISYPASQGSHSSEEELERFDEFIRGLSPDDF